MVELEYYDVARWAVGGAYVCALGCVLVTKLFAPFHRLLLHGKTLADTGVLASTLAWQKTVDWCVGLTVPKSYFTHFYVLLTAYCGAIQVYAACCGRAVPTKYRIIHYLLWFQGVRRLYECVYVARFLPTSRINVLHYLVGVGHYTLVSLNCGLSYANGHGTVRRVSMVDWAMVAAFAAASYDQYSNHVHLASLRKYTVPLFRYVSSPHYLNEIQLYGIVFVVSISDGFCTQTEVNFLLCWTFVTLNLAISALENYNYYKHKFDDFALRWSIVPGVL